MGCGCHDNMSPRSFGDLSQMDPKDPREIIDYVQITSGAPIPGIWGLSNDYFTPTPPSVWGASPVSLAAFATVTTNHTDDQQMVYNASAYTQANVQSTAFSTGYAPPLRKIVYCRSGIEWRNSIPLTFPSSPAIVEVQLSFLDNAATRGDSAGTVPVFTFLSGSFVVAPSLQIVLKRSGRYSLGLLTIDNNSPAGYGMFELDIVSV
jgi:hypothetical protein